MNTVSVDREGMVSIVRLTRGVTNALNPECIRDLIEALRSVRRDEGVSSIVLTSANTKFFSIGLDIPDLFDLSRKDFRRFYHDFNQVCLDLYTMPKPTVAAITGHAIAAGCILALCCDYRFIAEGRKLMGLNEVKIGVPVPYLGDCVTRDLIGVRYARGVIEGGEFYQPEAAREMGLIDEIVPLDRVLDAATEKAEVLGSLCPGAFPMIKRNRVEAIQQEFLLRRKEKAQVFIDQWYSPDARKLLKQAMEKF